MNCTELSWPTLRVDSMKNNAKRVVREATLNDLEALVALEAEVFDYSRIGRRSFANLLRSNSAKLWAIDDVNSTRIAGYALVLTRKNSRKWRIYSIASAPWARGQGIGKLLLQMILTAAQEQEASHLTLEVKTDNKGAIALYEDFGFSVVDILLGYYDHGEDGYKMQLTLPPASPTPENR